MGFALSGQRSSREKRVVARLCAAAAVLSATSCTAQEPAGITFLAGSWEAGAETRQIDFALDRGDGWQDVEAHGFPYDSRSFDYPLDPGTTVQVRAATITADGSRVEVSLPVSVEEDIAYGLYAIVSPQDPTAQCMGCGTPVSAALDPARPDGKRLWLYETYNGISAPIIF